MKLLTSNWGVGLFTLLLFILLFAFLLLSGCAGDPVLITKPQEVHIPGPTKYIVCKTSAPAVPAWATEGVKKDCTSMQDKEAKLACYAALTQAALEELAQRIGYEILLRGALQSCTTAVPTIGEDK